MLPPDSDTGRRKKLLRGTLVVGFWTFLSRLLGMARDMATAAVLGMSSGGIMDSFVIAFRIPDIARKLFGDGTLGVSFLPVFAKAWHNDRDRAWTLLSVMLAWVFLGLSGIVLLGEIFCLWGFSSFSPESKVYLVSHLLALMLPYLILICMTAVTTATLQTLGRFSLAASIPTVLNLVWLAGILWVVPAFSDEPSMQCYILALCILLAGVLQFVMTLPVLRALGFRLDFRFRVVSVEIRNVFSDFFPQLFGLMSVSLNMLAATGIAWLFSGPAGGTIRWLGHLVQYPLRPGAASSIYFSERLFEFPQGLIGLAVATVIYPLLSRHAARRDFKAFGDDLTLGMRIQFVFSIPAGVGLMMMADRLAHLLFQRGAFTPSDTYRTGDMIFWFGLGVWGFCSLPIVIRAFYVLGDTRTPCRVGILGCLLNLILGLALIRTMHEQGLALALSVTTGLQAVLLIVLFAIRHGHINFGAIVLCIVRSCCATFFMALAVAVVMKALPGQDSFSDILHIVLGGLVGVLVYFTALRLFGGREFGILVRGRVKKKKRYEKTNRRRR